MTEEAILAFRRDFEAIEQEIGKAIIGQKTLIRDVLTAMVAGGNVLLEGLPGLGKTQLVKTIGKVLDLQFSRIQFTPDLMPADVTGTSVMIKDGEGMRMEFRQGPVFSNIVLADEINRATPKTQSALLEAMQERQVTLGETTYRLPDPFLVLATQNPIDQEGTYQLPEAQLDRFLFKVVVTYPSREEELQVLDLMASSARPPETSPVTTPEQVAASRDLVNQIYIDDAVRGYIVDLVRATRFPETVDVKLRGLIRAGASPRATINLALASRANAFVHHRSFVTPQDIKDLAHDILRHRILLSYEAEAENISTDDVIDHILTKVPVP